jgi:hypothetical protein
LADASTHRRLQEILLADDEACEWFDRVSLVHSLLHLDGYHDTLELPPSVFPDRALEVALGASDHDSHFLHLSTKASASRAPRSIATRLSGGGGLGGRYRLLMAIAASLLIVATGVGSLLYATHSARPFRGEEVATVRAAVGARFAYGSDGDTRPKPGSSLRQGRYELLDGLLEIEYPSGANLVIMSPAEFRLADAMRVELVDGKLSADIPEAAIGFTVDTVGGSVVDLGTSFGVEARRGESADVHVFEGEVRVETAEETGEAVVPLQLFAGHASRINPFSSIPSGIDVDHLRFVRHLGVARNRYADAILALKPAVYYRMEPVGDGDWLEDCSPSGAHAKIHTSTSGGSPWTGGKVGAAFALGGPSQQTFAVAADYPKAEGDELTVVCWVYAESRPFWASISKNWGNPVTRGQFHFGLLGFTGELAAHIFDPDNPCDEEGYIRDVCAQDSVPLPLHEWHHVAMVADGSTLRLYRNGVEVGRAPYESLHMEPNLRALAIGTKLEDSGDSPADMPNRSMWDGRLDELAIFNHALSPNEIRNLYELSRDSTEVVELVVQEPQLTIALDEGR